MTVYNRAEDIALDISGRLAQITTANGYETDIGLRTYRGRLHIPDESVPCSSLVEGDDNLGKDENLNKVQLFQDYGLVGYATCNPDNPNDTAHAIIRDMKKAIFKDGYRLNEKVRSVRYKGRTIGPRADGSAIVSAVVMIRVEYAEDLTKP